MPHTPPSSRHFSSKGLKRNVSDLDDSEEDVIYVQTTPKPAAVVDLTKSNRPKRQTSFLGRQDDDVIIIDPPAAEIRKQLWGLIHRSPRVAEVQSRKRQKRTHAEIAPGRGSLERPLGQSREEVEAPVAMPEARPEANASEASVLLQSVESVTHFFTLATEIRDKIYRHLLVSPKPIQVQRLWTEPRRQTTRRGRSADDFDITPLDTKILSVCKRTAIEGTRVLYSENTFLYLLRDPEVVENASNGGARKSERVKARKEKESRSINLDRYGHLIRHMAIELEPNRTDASYEKLMSAALKALAPAAASPPRLPIHLHTLTITISPLFQFSQRTVRASAPGNQDVVIPEGRFLSMVGFFSRGAPVLKALQRVHVDFLRINVHVNSNLTDNRRAGGTANPLVNLSEDEVDDDADSNADLSDAEPERVPRPKRRHLETTIDLRCLPRHLEALAQESQLWVNDPLIQEKRRLQGLEAQNKLAHLRRHIEDACLRPEQALREKTWEEHGAAVRRRREQRAKEEARFDADAYDAGDDLGGGGDDGRIARGMKSLIISIDRVGDELRAYRA
jgi:hypothetical protein